MQGGFVRSGDYWDKNFHVGVIFFARLRVVGT